MNTEPNNSLPVMNAVESSNIEAIGYNAHNQILQVNFKNKKSYCYQGVPPELWDEFQKAESKGGFLTFRIKNKYKHFEYTEEKSPDDENKPCA